MEKEIGFLSLLQSVDAFFPIGAFTLSNGLEDYVMRDRIKSCDDLSEYLKGFITILPYNDLGMASLAYRNYSDGTFIRRLDQIAGAVKGASEIRSGSNRMCSRYLKAREAMSDCPQELTGYQDMICTKKARGYHPIALGIYAAATGIEEDKMLLMYGYSIVSAIVNNAVKLVPLSQLKGQKVLYDILKQLEKVIPVASAVRLEDVGITGIAYELHCMDHETLYSRQYMS